MTACVWAGSSPSESVCVSSPPLLPSGKGPSLNVGPLKWIGIRPRRSGRAKLTRPSPPKVVPSNENSAWFWLIGRSAPSHRAQPFGPWPLGPPTKLKIRISPRYGSLMSGGPWSRSGEDPGQRDDEVDRQERRHVVVRLAAARRLDGRGIHARIRRRAVDLGARLRRCRPDPVGRDVAGPGTGPGPGRVRVAGHLG